jgi:predicted ABC-type sugar transport system permease subunit
MHRFLTYGRCRIDCIKNYQSFTPRMYGTIYADRIEKRIDRDKYTLAKSMGLRPIFWVELPWGTSVFGGMGTIFGTFVGAIIIGSLEAGIIAIGLTGFWIQLIYGLIIMVSVSIYAILLKEKK